MCKQAKVAYVSTRLDVLWMNVLYVIYTVMSVTF